MADRKDQILKRLADEDIEAYLASGEWRGKAGGYAAQGLAGTFIVKMVGSYTNVVGLPLYETTTMLAGDGLTFNMDNCDVLGSGATTIIAQNGVQASFGPSGTIARSRVSQHLYTPLTFVSTGLLLFDAGAVDVTDSTLDDNNVGAYYIDTDGTVSASAVHNLAATAVYGIALDDSAAALTGGSRIPPIELFDAEALRGEDGPGAGNTVNITDSTLIGHDEADSFGISAYASGASLTLNVTGSQIRDWDYGIDTFESAGTIVGTVVQQPYEWGYQGMLLMAKYLEGDKSGIPADELIIVPTKIIDKDNVDAFEAELIARIKG